MDLLKSFFKPSPNDSFLSKFNGRKFGVRGPLSLRAKYLLYHSKVNVNERAIYL